MTPAYSDDETIQDAPILAKDFDRLKAMQVLLIALRASRVFAR
jgi:hypothetical protein